MTHSKILDIIKETIDITKINHISKPSISGCNAIKLYYNDFLHATNDLELLQNNDKLRICITYQNDESGKSIQKTIRKERKDYAKKFGKHSIYIQWKN
jgi:hypothetical protein